MLQNVSNINHLLKHAQSVNQSSAGDFPFNYLLIYLDWTILFMRESFGVLDMFTGLKSDACNYLYVSQDQL